MDSGSWLYKGKPHEVVIQDGVCHGVLGSDFQGSRRRVSGCGDPLLSGGCCSHVYGKGSEALPDIIEEMLVEKTVLTPDLGGTATTGEVGDEVVRRLVVSADN